MVLDVWSIIYYGRYYQSKKNSYMNYWWFCRNDYNIYYIKELLSNYSYKSEQEIIDSGIYIAVFTTDIIALEKRFMSYHNEKALENILKNCIDGDYDIAFKIYIERQHLEDSWYIYEREELCKAAIQWCIENHISYKTYSN